MAKKSANSPPKREKPVRSPDSDPRDVVENAARVLDEAVTALGGCVQRVKADLALDDSERKYSTSLGSHLAFLAKGLTTVLGQMRQLEKQEARAVEKMTVADEEAMTIEYLLHASPGFRQEVRRRMDELDGKESIL